MRFTRLFTAAIAAGALVLSVGCAATPPPVSQQVQEYYDANKDLHAGQSGTSAATPVAQPVSLERIKATLVTNPVVTISVLGDSTGDAQGEWVDLWAQHLAASATVSVHSWDQASEDWYPTATTYPGPDGRIVEIWNASKQGAAANYPATRIKVMQPSKPDFMILSFGHNGQASAMGPNMLTTMSAVTQLWNGKIPAIAVIQNAAGEPRTNVTDANQAALKHWASINAVPTIDVRASFDRVADIKTVLLDDGTGVHPNSAGQKLWLDAVIASLG